MSVQCLVPCEVCAVQGSVVCIPESVQLAMYSGHEPVTNLNQKMMMMET